MSTQMISVHKGNSPTGQEHAEIIRLDLNGHHLCLATQESHPTRTIMQLRVNPQVCQQLGIDPSYALSLAAHFVESYSMSQHHWEHGKLRTANRETPLPKLMHDHILSSAQKLNLQEQRDTSARQWRLRNKHLKVIELKVELLVKQQQLILANLIPGKTQPAKETANQ